MHNPEAGTRKLGSRQHHQPLGRTDIRAIRRDNTMLITKDGRMVMSSDNPRRRLGERPSDQVLLFPAD
jgi:hypothetical protein